MGIMKLPSVNWRLQIRRKGITVHRVFAAKEDAAEEERRYLRSSPRPAPALGSDPASKAPDKRTIGQAWTTRTPLNT
jgi:hypothetical protein